MIVTPKSCTWTVMIEVRTLLCQYEVYGAREGPLTGSSELRDATKCYHELSLTASDKDTSDS